MAPYTHPVPPRPTLPFEMGDAVSVLYSNYRGDRDWRRVRPLRLWWGSTAWHPVDQWLVDVIDEQRGVSRSFALADIEEVRLDRPGVPH